MSTIPLIGPASLRIINSGTITARVDKEFFSTSTVNHNALFKWMASNFSETANLAGEQMIHNGTFPDNHVETRFTSRIGSFQSVAVDQGSTVHQMEASIILFYPDQSDTSMKELAEALHELQATSAYLATFLYEHKEKLSSAGELYSTLDALLFAWRDREDSDLDLTEDRDITGQVGETAAYLLTRHAMSERRALSLSFALWNGVYDLQSLWESILEFDFPHLSLLISACGRNWGNMPFFNIIFHYILDKIASIGLHTANGRCVAEIIKHEISPLLRVGRITAVCGTEPPCEYIPPMYYPEE